MELITHILDLLDQAFREEQAFVATLSDEERAVLGSPDRWSAKDTLIHIAIWKEWLVENLESIGWGEPSHILENIDQLNLEIFEEHRYDSWEEAIERSECASRSLIQRIQTVKVNDLTQTQLLSWQGDRPLWKLIVDSGYIHPIFHLSQHYAEYGVEHGGLNYGTQILEEAAKCLKELDGSLVI